MHLIKWVFVLVVLLVSACDSASVEEFAFRKTMELDLVEECGDNPSCTEAVKTQLADCMVKSKWRQFMNDSENQEELRRFVNALYSCIVDEEGNPYFESNLE